MGLEEEETGQYITFTQIKEHAQLHTHGHWEHYATGGHMHTHTAL